MVAVIAVVLFFAVMAMVSSHETAESLVREWACKNDMELVKCHLRLFRRGPFWQDGAEPSLWGGQRRGDMVFRIEVRDAEGLCHKGYARCRVSLFERGTTSVILDNA
jgi:hypothetical protein